MAERTPRDSQSTRMTTALMRGPPTLINKQKRCVQTPAAGTKMGAPGRAECCNSSKHPMRRRAPASYIRPLCHAAGPARLASREDPGARTGPRTRRGGARGKAGRRDGAMRCDVKARCREARPVTARCDGTIGRGEGRRARAASIQRAGQSGCASCAEDEREDRAGSWWSWWS
jgi:hypothetical protein